MNGRNIRERGDSFESEDTQSEAEHREPREKNSNPFISTDSKAKEKESAKYVRREKSSAKQHRNKLEAGSRELVNPRDNRSSAQKGEQNLKEQDIDINDYQKPKARLGADEISELLQNIYEFRVKNSLLYYYNRERCCWVILESSLEHRELRALVPREERGSISKNSLSEVYEWLLIDSQPLIQNPKSKFFLNFKDCSVNWENEKVVTEASERKKMNFTYFLDVDFLQLKTKQNTFREFTSFVFNDDEETLREFNKFLGLALSEYRNLKMAFFLFGPSNTGKSVVLNLLKMLIGANRCSSVSFSQLGENFAITRLIGKRINISGEVSGTGNKKLDVFKSLTGNDDIEISYKSRDFFTYANECMFVFACNNYPAVLSVPEFDSYLSRVFFIPFNNVRDREEWIEGLEYQLFEDAYSVIQAAMQGLRDFRDDHFKLVESESMKECKQDYRGLFDSFSLFAEAHIKAEPEAKVSSKEITAAYTQFCAEQSYQTLDSNIWSQLLKQRFGCSSCTRVNKENGKRERAYKGICLCDIEENSSWIVTRHMESEAW